MKRLKKIGLRLLSLGLTLLQWGLLIGLALFLTWRSAPARWWLSRQAALATSRLLNQTVTLAPVEGKTPWDLRLPWLRMADEQGRWLEVLNLEIKADWRAALRRNWVLTRISAESIDIHHWPAFEREPSTPEKRQTTAWTPFQVLTVRLDRVVLPAPAATAALALTGAVNGSTRAIRFSGAAQAEWLEARTHVRGDAAWTREGPHFDLEADLSLGPAGLAPWTATRSLSNLAARAVLTGGDGLQPLTLNLTTETPHWGTGALHIAQIPSDSAANPWRTASAHLRASVNPNGLSPRWLAMLGTPWRAQGRLDWDAGSRRLSLSETELSSPALDGRLSGSWTGAPDDRRHQASFQGAWVPDPETVRLLGVDFHESIRFDAELEHSPRTSRADITLATPVLHPAPRLQSPELLLHDPILRLNARREADKGRTEFEASFEARDSANQTLTALLDASWADERLDVTMPEWRWGSASASLTGHWARASGQLVGRGTLVANLGNWRLWPDNIDGADTQGDTEWGFDTHGNLASGNWRIDLDGALWNGIYRQHRIPLAETSLQLTGDRRTGWSTRGRMTAHEASFADGAVMADRVILDLMTGNSLLDWSLELEGAVAMQPLILTAQGGMDPRGERWHLTGLTALAPPLTLANAAPLILRRDADLWRIADSRWQLNHRAELALSGWIAPGDRVLDVAVDLSGALVPGEWIPALASRNWRLLTDAHLHLWGPLNAPRAQLDAVSQWAERLGRRLERHADVTLAARLDSRGALAEFHLTAGQDGFMSIETMVPLTDMEGNDGWRWTDNEDAWGALSARMDLDWLLSARLPDVLRLTGWGEAEAQASWRPQTAPRIDGSLLATELMLDAPQWGVQLRDGHLEARTDGTETLTLKGAFSDVLGNPMTVNGVFGWQSGDGPTLELQAAAPRFVPIRTESATITTRIKLALQGAPGNLTLTGGVHLIEAALTGMPTLPLNVPHMEVEDIGLPVRPRRRRPTAAATPSPPPPPAPARAAARDRPGGLAFDLRFSVQPESLITSPDARMRWQGELRLLGPVEALAFEGRLSLVRGHVTLLGRRLTLQEGELLFSGEPIPDLEFVAESRGGGVIAQIIVTGPANNPSIRVESDPPMADDEVLSYILFRRGLGRIGPYQAYQLAQVLRRIHGGGAAGLDLLGHGRRLLPVDEINIVYTTQDGSDEEAAALTLGKYVGSRLYVAGTQGLETGSGRVSVEVELTRRITLETEIRADMRSGLGLSWKWDY